MSEKITGFRVFIASPGGLQEERRAFRDTLQKYNEAEAIERKFLFIPVGWESTLGGVGRPQDLIIEDLIRCDYFVLVLWDRWGTPPQAGIDGPYTSGTEEEFQIALRCFEDPKLPMEGVAVFFKEVDHHQKLDPGPQLQRVLEFQKTLDEDRKILFHTFDRLSAFEDRLRQFLASWVRDHERKTSRLKWRAPADRWIDKPRPPSQRFAVRSLQ